jgi:hypothetical protein
LSATGLDYGNPLLGIRGAAQTLTLTNDGTSSLSINSPPAGRAPGFAGAFVRGR